MISIILQRNNIFMKKRNKYQFRKIYIILGWLIIWQILSLLVGNSILLVGPLETGKALAVQAVTVRFWQTIGCSWLRIAAGFFAGAGAGLILAAASARFPVMEEILSPVFALIKAVPVASFVVLFLIWWHSDILSVAISFCVVLPNIYISTLEGIHSTDGRLLEMAKVFGLSRHDTFFYLYRPALKPFLDSSIRISVGLGWKSGVAAEVIGTPAFSIGERLYMSKIYLETADVLAWTAVTILLSVLSEKALLWLWNRFCNWTPACKGTAVSQENHPLDSPSLIMEKVEKTYDGKKIIDGFNAQYSKGETACFMTPSGSGKTTLLRLIAGLEQPDVGNIYRNGRVGMVFQEDRLCEEYSALINVSMITGDTGIARQHLLQLLEEDDIIRPCRELSGGMKRRVAIARAFASQSDILLLDEPYTGLDGATIEKVQRYMEQYRKGRTILMATHIRQQGAQNV